MINRVVSTKMISLSKSKSGFKIKLTSKKYDQLKDSMTSEVKKSNANIIKRLAYNKLE